MVSPSFTMLCSYLPTLLFLFLSLPLSPLPPSPSQSERDVSVRMRAIDLLYAMCDHTNAKTIVEELMTYLQKADYSIRETLVSGTCGVWCDMDHVL